MSRQCGQCQRPDCPVSAKDSPTPENNDEMEMVDQPFAASEIGESMDADLLPELSGETWVASALTEEFTADLPVGNTIDLIAESHSDETLTVIREWIQSNSTPAWADCAGLSPELRCWGLQIRMAGYGGNEHHRRRVLNWWSPVRRDNDDTPFSRLIVRWTFGNF